MRTDLQRLKRDTETGRFAVVSGSLPAASSIEALESNSTGTPGTAVSAQASRPANLESAQVGASAASAGSGQAISRSGRAKLVWILAAIVVVAVGASGLYYRSHRSKPLTDKDTIILGDFANNTGDPVFDDTLKTALSVSLNQSPFLNVLSDSKVAATLKLMTRPRDTRLTPEVAREVCQRAGSKAYLAGSITSLGSQFVLELKAVNCQSEDLLAEEQVTAASKEKVLDSLGEAASKLRGELGESLATVQRFDVPLEQATTSSLEALKAYSLGNKARNARGAAAALPYHQRAIELDPNFAMGYRAVDGDYSSLGELGRAAEYSTKAFQLRDHASEREKLRITASYYQDVTGEMGKAAQTYQEEIESYRRGMAGVRRFGRNGLRAGAVREGCRGYEAIFAHFPGWIFSLRKSRQLHSCLATTRRGPADHSRGAGAEIRRSRTPQCSLRTCLHRFRFRRDGGTATVVCRQAGR